MKHPWRLLSPSPMEGGCQDRVDEEATADIQEAGQGAEKMSMNLPRLWLWTNETKVTEVANVNVVIHS